MKLPRLFHTLSRHNQPPETPVRDPRIATYRFTSRDDLSLWLVLAYTAFKQIQDRAYGGDAAVHEPAAAYVRVAFAPTSVEEALSEHTRQVQAFADQRGYDIIRIYSDVGSGLDLNRPGLQQMLADAEAGLFGVLITRDPSRLSRSLPQFCDIFTRLTEQRPVEMVFVNTHIETYPGRL